MSKRNSETKRPCPQCGGTSRMVTMFDGPTCGGHRTTCATCGYVLESKTYHAKKRPEKISYLERKAFRTY